MRLIDHPLFSTYHNMKARCSNKNLPNYKYYGGKGVKICDRWLGKDGLVNFIEDMGERPRGYQLDRVDVNGNYCKENCRWVNKYIQMGNTTNNNTVPGVGWHKQKSKYRARIKVKGKEISLGLYHNFQDAVDARNKAYKEICS
jgi:hypothetical protein